MRGGDGVPWPAAGAAISGFLFCAIFSLRGAAHCVLYPRVYFWAISPQKRCQAPARSQHAPRPWALPAAARRPRARCPGERPPPLAPPRPLPAHGRRASPRSRASRRFADATVYPRSLAIESDDPIFRVAEVCLHPLPKAHALWREKVIAAGPAISHFATHPQQARSRRAAAAQVLRPPREGERPLLRTIGPRHPGRRRRRPNGRLGRFPPRLGYTLSRRSSGAPPHRAPPPSLCTAR